MYSPTEANIVQMVLSFGPNQREASLVGAYSRKGWAQAQRNWLIMATKKPALLKTLEHTMGSIVLNHLSTAPTRLKVAPRYSC